MKTRFYVILTILSVMAIFSLTMFQTTGVELKNSIQIGKTLYDYSKEVKQARIEFSYDTSEGYKFYPGGQEKFDEKYQVITQKREKIYTSNDSFTKYFSNLTTIKKVSFIASRTIAILFYILVITLCAIFWVTFGINSLKRKKRHNKRIAHKKSQNNLVY